MKRASFIFKKKLALTLSIVIVLIGLLPLSAGALEADSGIIISGIEDATGVNTTLSNPTSAIVNANLILAIYGPDGKLVYGKAYPVSVEAGASVNQRFEYDIASIAVIPGYSMKLFAWDKVSYAPLCKEVTSARYLTIDGNDVVFDGVNVIGDSSVTEFKYVALDEFQKRGTAYTAVKSGDGWTFAPAEGIDVVIAFKPGNIIGGALPDVKLTELRMPNGNNTMRAVISL